MKYRKTATVEAHQWFKNGDHPRDESYMVEPDPRSGTQFEPFLSEGKVVRRYCSRGLGEAPCTICGKKMNAHGWIESLEGYMTVCPGDYIITGVAGENYPCKPEIFEKTYEKVTD